MIGEPLRRVSAGDYMTRDERYRIIYGWGDTPGVWVLIEYAPSGDADVLEDCQRLRDARTSLAGRRGTK